MAIDVLSLFGKNTKLIVLPQYVRWLMKNPDAPLINAETGPLIIEQLEATPRNRNGSFSASSAGTCERAQVFQFYGAESASHDAGLTAIFNDGKWRHARWQSYLLQAGILTDIEFPLFWNRMKQRGTMDGQGVVPDDHIVKAWQGLEFGFELKGVNAFAYSNLVKKGPMEKHLAQIHRYMLLSGLKLFSLVYENKSTQEMHEWVITRDEREVDKQRDEVNYLVEMIEEDDLPPQLPECALGKGAWRTCSYGGKDGVCTFANSRANNANGSAAVSIEIHRKRP